MNVKRYAYTQYRLHNWRKLRKPKLYKHQCGIASQFDTDKGYPYWYQWYHIAQFSYAYDGALQRNKLSL